MCRRVRTAQSYTSPVVLIRRQGRADKAARDFRAPAVISQQQSSECDSMKVFVSLCLLYIHGISIEMIERPFFGALFVSEI